MAEFQRFSGLWAPTMAVTLICAVSACGNNREEITAPDSSLLEPEFEAPAPTIPVEQEAGVTPFSAPEALHMYKLDCGRIEIADAGDSVSDDGLAVLSGEFTNSCFLVLHPDGTLLWDLGLPGQLAGTGEQIQGIYTMELDLTLPQQLLTIGMTVQDIDYFSLSHSGFDHIGQVDQLVGGGAVWIVQAQELAFMTPDEDDQDPTFAQFADFERIVFDERHDVFGDETVVILEAAGHTPGHSVLLVDLPETGPVILLGDLYQRVADMDTGRVPSLNWDVLEAANLGTAPGEITRASMERIAQVAADLDARQIVPHDPGSAGSLPEFPIPAQ